MKRIGLALLVLFLAFLIPAELLCSAGSFFFVQIADTQLGMSMGNDLSPEVDNFSRAVKDINRLKPAFVVITGDLINTARSPKQIRAFWRVAHEITPDIPLFLMPGNHDLSSVDAAGIGSYNKLFGKDFYSFRYQGSEFIILNSPLIHEAKADKALRDVQRQWFEKTLHEAQTRKPSHIFVFAHHPWFLSNADEDDSYLNIPKAQRRDYLDLMIRCGVKYSFAGHLHREVSATYGDLKLVATSSLRKALGDDPVGFRIVHVCGDKVESTYYPLDKVPESINATAVTH